MTLEETADRIALRFVARCERGQMRHPFYWIFRVTKAFDMHDGPRLAMVMSRIEDYVTMLAARQAMVNAAMAERPSVLN